MKQQMFFKKYTLVIYFGMVFGIEWILFFLLRELIPPMAAILIGSWLPNLAGVLVTAAADGRAGLRTLFGKLLQWRVGLVWYLVSFLIAPLSILAAFGIQLLTGRALPEMTTLNMLPMMVLIALVTGATGEELGWRGTALPRMQVRWNPLVSSLILGILWGLYHLPAFFISGTPQSGVSILNFMTMTLGLNLLISWIFNHTRGSLLSVMLVHFSFNFFGSASGVYTAPEMMWWFAGCVWLVVIFVVVFDWKRFTIQHTIPERFPL